MTTKQQTTECAPMMAVLRNSMGLRDALFDELDAIRQGKSSTSRANAVAKIATGIVETVRMELEVQRYIRSEPPQKLAAAPNTDLGLLGTPLTLGRGGDG
jgi:hypothetical protein